MLISGTNRFGKREKRKVCADVLLHVNSVIWNSTAATAAAQSICMGKN